MSINRIMKFIHRTTVSALRMVLIMFSMITFSFPSQAHQVSDFCLRALANKGQSRLMPRISATTVIQPAESNENAVTLLPEGILYISRPGQPPHVLFAEGRPDGIKPLGFESIGEVIMMELRFHQFGGNRFFPNIFEIGEAKKELNLYQLRIFAWLRLGRLESALRDINSLHRLLEALFECFGDADTALIEIQANLIVSEVEARVGLALQKQNWKAALAGTYHGLSALNMMAQVAAIDFDYTTARNRLVLVRNKAASHVPEDCLYEAIRFELGLANTIHDVFRIEELRHKLSTLSNTQNTSDEGTNKP